jgi:hypothetical protein
MIGFVRFTIPLRRPDAPCQSASPERSKALHEMKLLCKQPNEGFGVHRRPLY